jgi:hypothetical protein
MQPLIVETRFDRDAIRPPAPPAQVRDTPVTVA